MKRFDAHISREGLPATRLEQKERAVALRYTETDELPKIVASGAGELARRILKIAGEHGVPIYEDRSLVQLLSSLKPGATISQESYDIVAQLISFLYHTDLEWRRRHSHLKLRTAQGS